MMCPLPCHGFPEEAPILLRGRIGGVLVDLLRDGIFQFTFPLREQARLRDEAARENQGDGDVLPQEGWVHLGVPICE